jgi:hypothetical protein
LEVTLIHEKLTTAIGQPAILLLGNAFPSLRIVSERAGILYGELAGANGRWRTKLPVRELKAFQSAIVEIPGTLTDTGNYEIRLKLTGNDWDVYDTLYFSVWESEREQSGGGRIVYRGEDGKLAYTPDYRGNRIPDFSYAGYKGGGVPIPHVSVAITVGPGDGDAEARIQEAIDYVSKLAPDRDGFRGTVLLREGTYRIAGTLRIQASGVVVRGGGKGEDGSILVAAGTGRRALIEVRGESDIHMEPTTGRKIIDLYVPVGSRTFHVNSAVGLSVGDTIVVRRYGNRAWISEIGMDRIAPRPGNPQETKQWQPFPLDFERTIVEIDGNQVTIDAPIVCAIEERWGGGEIFPYTDLRISQVGVEHLRLVSEYDKSVRADYRGEEYAADEEHAWDAVVFHNVRDAWAQHIETFHFADSGFLAGREAKWITVQDCSVLDPISVLAGGRRYSFKIDGQLVLMQRNYTELARHGLVLNSRVSGPNVFLDSAAVHQYNWSEPHHRWSVGGLYDNAESPIAIQDRQYLGTGHGWAGANYVLWNSQGRFILQKPPTAQNYAIGQVGERHPGNFVPREEGYLESRGRRVEPRSLYLSQLEDRLGNQAVDRQVGSQ